MGALFSSTANSYISATLALTALPWTIGCWVFQPTGASSGPVWGINASNKCNLNTDTSNGLTFVAGTNSFSAATFAVAGWYYAVARYISATNRRLAVLHPDGSVTHGSSSNNKTYSGGTQINIGADNSNSAGDNIVAEMAQWIVDIQPDGAQISDWLVRALAYGGPFALPHLLPNLVCYKPLRASLGSSTHLPEDGWVGRSTPLIWTNTNAATLAAHPIVYGNYLRPPRVGPTEGMM